MALVTTKEMFAKALDKDYAVGAFNVNNMEIIQKKLSAISLRQGPNGSTYYCPASKEKWQRFVVCKLYRNAYKKSYNSKHQ